MIRYGVVAHGGVGSPLRFSDGCAKACGSAFKLLEKGSSALDAVTEAARVLEDDGRFNAGSGSTLRLDGTTIEMDAGLMDSQERIGIVISVRNIRNPVVLARALMETPHVALAGQGAELFARKRGLPSFRNVSTHSRQRYRKLLQTIKRGELGEHDPRWEDCDLRSLWNLEVPYAAIFGTDTIGVVALDKEGNTAVANSTGGASPMLLGRVGDSPMVGCGFYAGISAAVACTGIGEEIIKKMLAKTVYDLVASGVDVKAACRQGIRPFPGKTAVGLIAISTAGCAVVANRQMAHFALIKEQ